MTAASSIGAILDDVRRRATAAGVFADVRIDGGRLVCPAKASAAPAEYRVDPDGGRLWVSLVTADRWLSQSIEADLVHTGDKLEELLDEELVELGVVGAKPVFEHFRSEDKLFTFRTPVAGHAAGTEVAAWLLAYEAMFRRLGDMAGGDED